MWSLSMADEQRQPERIWSSRKFVSAWAITWLATLLLIGEYINPTVWGSTLSLVWCGYFAGNVGDKFADRRK